MSISDIWKRNIVETSVWIAVFSLLTFSNISYDLFLSLKLAALLTAGMFVVTLVNRVFLFPYFLMKNRMILFILLASIIIASFTFIVYHFEDAVVSSHYTETYSRTMRCWTSASPPNPGPSSTMRRSQRKPDCSSPPNGRR